MLEKGVGRYTFVFIRSVYHRALLELGGQNSFPLSSSPLHYTPLLLSSSFLSFFLRHPSPFRILDFTPFASSRVYNVDRFQSFIEVPSSAMRSLLSLLSIISFIAIASPISQSQDQSNFISNPQSNQGFIARSTSSGSSATPFNGLPYDTLSISDFKPKGGATKAGSYSSKLCSWIGENFEVLASQNISKIFGQVSLQNLAPLVKRHLLKRLSSLLFIFPL